MKNYALLLPIYFHNAISYLLLLTLGIMLLNWFYYRSRKNKLSLIAKKGVKIDGRVIKHIPKRFHYYIVFSYIYGDKQYIQKQSIYQAEAKELPEETVVALYCLPFKPENAILAETDTYFASYYLMAISLAFFLFFVACTIVPFSIALFS